MRIRRFAKVLAAFLVGVMLVHPLFPNRENRACATLHNAGFFIGAYAFSQIAT